MSEANTPEIINREVNVTFLKDFMRALHPDTRARTLIESLLVPLGKESSEESFTMAMAGIRSITKLGFLGLPGASPVFLTGLLAGVGLALGSSSDSALAIHNEFFKKPENVHNFAEALAKRAGK